LPDRLTLAELTSVDCRASACRIEAIAEGDEGSLEFDTELPRTTVMNGTAYETVREETEDGMLAITVTVLDPGQHDGPVIGDLAGGAR